MAEKDFSGADAAGQPSPAPVPAPKRRRKLRILLTIAAALVIGLILLVLAAPTIISTKPVVSSILEKVNANLNGKVEVSSLSLGWFSGVKADGVRVTDAGGIQIAEIDHAVVPYPLWKAITGKLSFGDITLDGVSFDARKDAQGQLNFAQLVKPGPASPTTVAPSSPASDSKPSKLPDVSVNLKLTNCRGTFSQAGKPTIYLTKLDGEIKIPDINQPIVDQFTAGLKVGDQPEGSISITGSAAAIKANAIAIDSAEIHQTVDVQNLDLQTAKPFIPDTVGVSTLDGALGIHIAVDLTGGKNAAIDAAITGTKPIVFGGQVLKGDNYSTQTFKIEIPKLTAAFPDGLDKWQSGRISVGAGAGSSPILLKVDQGQVTALADLSPQMILNLLAKKKPGADGQLVVTSNFDLAKIIPQLKHTLSQQEGVLIDKAGFSEKLTLAFSAEKTEFANIFDSTQITGKQNFAGAASQLIAIDPIHLSVNASDLGGGGDLPNLHNMNLTVTSKFANGEFKGDSLSDLNGVLKADLNVLREELSQFIDLKDKTFGGNVEITITDKGQLGIAPYQAGVQLGVNGSNLKYTDATHPQINEPMVQLKLSVDLQGSEKNAIETLKNVSLTLKTGDARAPTLDLLAEVPSITLQPAPAAADGSSSGYILADVSSAFKLTRFTADLAKLQRELAAVPSGKAGVVLNQGVLSVSSAGTFKSHSLTLDSLAVKADQLFVSRQLAGGQQINAVAGETVNLNLAAAINMTPATARKFDLAVDLKQLVLSDAGKIIDLHKDGDGDFAITRTSTGAMGGHGQLAIATQLGSINDIQKKLGQTEVTVKTTAGDVRSGTLTGTLALTSVAQSKTSVNADLKVENVVVTTATGMLAPQSATLNLKATTDQAFSIIAVEQAGLKSNLANALVTGATISLSSASVFDKLQSAHWQVDVPDLKPVMELANAFSPPTPAPATTAKPDPSSPKPLPPLAIDGGAVSMAGDLSHEGSTLKINVSDVSAKNVAFHRGDIKYAAKPVDFKLLAAVQTGDGRTVMEQIRQVEVTQLTGNMGVATLSMPTPIVISQLSTTPVANGGIQLVGNLTDLTQLLAAMQGQKPSAYPYRGDYTLTENVISQNNTLSLKGGMQIAKFQSYDGDKVTFSEDQVALANDLSLVTNGTDQQVVVTNLTAAMQSSGALNLVLKNANIAHLQSTRDMLLQPSITYDLAKLWPIIQPMMGDQYKTLKVTGVFTKVFNISGRYPVDQPSTIAIKTVNADGDLAVTSFDYNGLNLQNFIVPFTLANGQCVTVYANKPAGQNTAPPAIANSGTLDLSNLTIDLTQDPPRLTTPPKKVLISNVTINPVFADTFMAKVINNPLFATAKGATGLIDVSIDDCTNLPLGDLVMQQSPANTGRIDLHFSITKLNIGLPTDALSSILKQQSFEADVKDATVAIAKGISTQHIKFSTGQYVIGFDGDVRLKDQAFIPMTLGFPLATVAGKTHLADANTVQYVPDQIQVPVEGTVNSPKYRFDKVIPKAIADAAAKALTNGLLGGNKNNNGAVNGNGNNANPNNPNGNNPDPLGDLLKGLDKNKDKDKNKTPDKKKKP